MTTVTQSTMFDSVPHVAPLGVDKGQAGGSASYWAMRRLHGAGAAGLKCGDCVHCVRQRHNTKSYCKCDRTVMTRGAATDWRLKWLACGAWVARET